jgi:hypothetical protein
MITIRMRAGQIIVTKKERETSQLACLPFYHRWTRWARLLFRLANDGLDDAALGALAMQRLPQPV